MQSDHVPFYDSVDTEYDEDGRRFVDRIYCFAWDEFSEDEWDELGRVYETLPGWIGAGREGHLKNAPCWFSLGYVGGSHLDASVEPPGIQIAGNAFDYELNQWHERFLQLSRNLPRKVVDL